MDAKKIAKFIKPRYFNDTKANQFSRNCSLAVAVIGLVFTVFGIMYDQSHKDRFFRNNPVSVYLNSEEMLIRDGRVLNIIPHDKRYYSKLSAAHEMKINENFLKMNSLDEDLDDSALLCESLIPKRKAFQNGSLKSSKQIKLDSFKSSKKIGLKDEKNIKVLINDNVSSKKQITSESKLGEASSYFSERLSTCPLCLKSFKSDSAYSTHMKQCAKTHKMSTKQLLEALELQKKQMHERRIMGLRSQSFPSPKKHVSKNKIESYDLALGLALSKSLATCESKTLQEVTLEEFGFKCKSGGISRKKENDKKSILRERTSEERQRIIIEKVAVVLLDEEERVNLVSDKKNEKSSSGSEIPKLWTLGENNEKDDWYVTQIKTLVLLDEENRKRKSLAPTCNISNKILELNLPQKEFHECWKKMINNSTKSDLFGMTKDNKDVYLHSLVVFTRCPEVLENDFESIFKKYNLSTALILLEYLYCGTLNGLVVKEIDNLWELASEINFKELVTVLDSLKNKLESDSEVRTTPGLSDNYTEAEKTVVENEKLKFSEEKDLFSEDNFVDLTQEDNSDESNVEKSYWSFIQHEKKKKNLEEKQLVNSVKETNEIQEAETFQLDYISNLKTTPKTKELEMKSNNSGTGNLDEDAQPKNDCIILSSGSETQCNPPSPMDYEVPHYDPYNDFHMFTEEPFSPVGLNSQSLLVGDISAESLKLMSPLKEMEMDMNKDVEEQKAALGYCSTPVSVRQSSKIKSSTKEKYRKRRSDLSANRILRKSLGLQVKKTPKAKKNSAKKIGSSHKIVEALANSVLHELSKSKNFIEITPLANREEFGDSVTPSPNYSIMGESLIKEQLTRYGLKKNLAKSKAKKILRHIYEELHPLYNTETGKIVKMLPSNTPKRGKTKSKKNIVKNKGGRKIKKVSNELNSSKDSDETIGPNDFNSDESEFEDLNETLTQSMPSNPVDLPSAFCEFLQNNPDYHQKILLYEPIWLEELQKSLKETYKKHFKMSDLMDYLDQKCVTFRSAAQAKKLKERYQKKEISKKKLLADN